MNAAAIRAELEKAARLDAEARRHRERAGMLLRQAGGLRDVGVLARDAGIDSRLAELLMQMAPLPDKMARG